MCFPGLEWMSGGCWVSQARGVQIESDAVKGGFADSSAERLVVDELAAHAILKNTCLSQSLAHSEDEINASIYICDNTDQKRQ